MKNKFDNKYFKSFWRRGSDRGFHPIYTFRSRFISNLVNKFHAKKVLDIGCGKGFFVLALRNKNISALGIDISNDAFSGINETERKYFTEGDIRKLPYKSKSFDGIISVDVLEHIKKEDIADVVNECMRVAKKFIYLDITCLEDVFFIHSDPTHITKLYSLEWYFLLKKTLSKEWKIKRGPIIPFFHHAIFIIEKI